MKTKKIVPINLDWPVVKPIDYRKYITPIKDMPLETQRKYYNYK